MAAIPVLQTKGVARAFGGLQAIANCTITVCKEELVGIIGPNGAGKTTLFNLIGGQLAPDCGEILLAGSRISGLAPNEICRKGLARTFQLSRELAGLSVLENLLLASREQPRETVYRALFPSKRCREKEQALVARSSELLGRFGLSKAIDQYAGALSTGQKKMLEVARALMTDPSVLLLDEPTAGASREETTQLTQMLKGLQENGLTVLLVEHKMEVVMSLCQRVIVMNEGRVLATGTPSEITQNADVVEAYLGAA